MESPQAVKQRFEIIGNDPSLNRAIEKSIRVASTDISVLITGESGVGKESLPKIIHALSHRKHAKYIAVNCGAIPEGTIDSELFGHEKGAFTGANQARDGYFKEADGGTIFLDEVGELPLTTQVRLLRVLETGEFIKVGSSKVQKSDVRIVAATNVQMIQAIKDNKFREDLYYRLNTVEIHLSPLRERRSDIHLLFRKFASDFALKYKMPTIRLTDEAVKALENCSWPGNIRQLKNVTEQISVLETKREVDVETLSHYLPKNSSNLPSVISNEKSSSKGDFSNEREILYKVLFDMKSDLNDLKKLTMELMEKESDESFKEENINLIKKVYGDTASEKEFSNESHENQLEILQLPNQKKNREVEHSIEDPYDYAEDIEEEETLSLQDKEVELIKKSLERHFGKRKPAADELGISERTLYRKIKQYDL